MRQKSRIDFPTPDAYIASQPQPVRETIEKIRALVWSIVPDAKEVISYQVICYKYHYMLVGIGVTRDYCSFYVMSPGLVKQMKEELKEVKVSGSTLHFMSGQPLPEELIRKIVIARMMENQVRAFRKTHI